jgi:superfamily II DNA helicase RecQ
MGESCESAGESAQTDNIFEDFLENANFTKHVNWSSSEPVFSELQKRALQVFKKSPCLLVWQMKVALAMLQKCHVVCMTATGTGKSYPFWMPLVVQRDGIILVVTALNLLGNQMVSQLLEWNIPAINIHSEMDSFQNIQVHEII